MLRNSYQHLSGRARTRCVRGGERGFTLTEVVIVMVVIGVLAAIAIPSYQGTIAKARRADAQGALTALSQFMERFYTRNNRYDQDRGGTAVALPFSEAPQEGSNKFYDLTLPAVTASTFTLRATPKGGQAGDGVLEIDSTGATRWDQNGSGTIVAWD